MKGIIFDIQYGAMYDGPGLRTCVFFKGCPLRCVWCQNPESQLPRPMMSHFAERCASCGACADVCRQGALKMKNNLPVRDVEKCLICGECAAACRNNAMEKIGMEATAEEIAGKVRRDMPFYESSGGGATVSGGEPAMQPEFLMETLRAIKGSGIHTALETCGFFKGEMVDELLETVDLFLFDVKHIDPAAHKKHTGVSNETILANFEAFLSKAGNGRIIPRIPVIPGFNADEGAMSKIAAWLKRAGYAGPAHLMPYNPMAKTKWEKIGRGDEYRNMGELSEEALKKLVSCFQKESFRVVCNR